MPSPAGLQGERRMLEKLARELAAVESSIDALPVAYYQAGDDDVVTFANEALRALVDDSLPEGRSMREHYAEPDEREVFLRRLDREGGDAVILVNLKSGVRVEEHARVHDADGRRIVEGVMRDVTEQVAFERELDRYARALDAANARLKRNVEALDGFTRSVSHDLKTPLRGIIAYLTAFEEDAAAAGYAPPKDAGAHLAKARKAALRMEGMVTALLEVARFQKVAMEGSADADRVLTDVLDALAHEVRARQAIVERGPLPRVPVAAEFLDAVLRNLVGNALKYASENGRPVVRVSAEEEEDAWTFTVSDDGPGVPPAIRDRVFQLFVRGTANSADGTGAGLAIVRAAVEAWGGRVWVDDAPSGGAAFRFTVPKRGAPA